MALGSDHFPVLFTAGVTVGREPASGRIPKTLLQSTRMRGAAGLLYKVTLKSAGAQIENVKEAPEKDGDERDIQARYEQAQQTLKDPWEAQVRIRRWKSGPHVNGELIRLWKKKKTLYERWRWKPTERNKRRIRQPVRGHRGGSDSSRRIRREGSARGYRWTQKRESRKHYAQAPRDDRPRNN